MESKEIKLNIQITQKDFMDFQVSHFSLFKFKKWLMYLVFFVVFYSIIYAPYVLEYGWSGITISIFKPLLILPGTVIVLYFLLKYRTYNAFKTDSFISHPQEIIINEDGIIVNAYRSNINPLWKDIYKYNNTGSAIYIYLAELKAIMIPLRFLNEHDKTTLEKFLKNKVDTRRHTAQVKKNTRLRLILFTVVIVGLLFYVFKDYSLDKKMNRAYELQEAQNFAEAKKAYTELINMNPEDESNYVERACCKISLREFSSAILDCKTAINLNPKNGRAFYIYAFALYNNGMTWEACNAINKSIQLGYTNNTESFCDK